jgi:hypothetical protein
MKRTFLATTALLTFAVGPALAGNIDEPILEPAPAPIAMAPVAVNTGGDWTGFYAGGSLGFADASEDADAFDDDGVTYGLHGGYDYDFGTFVLGGELEISGFDLEDGANTVDSVARAKLRAGYDAGVWMPYVTAGVAQLNVGGLDLDDTGAVYGFGVDYSYTDNIRVGGEVLQHEFDNFADSGLNIDATTASLRVSFDF